MYWRPWCSWGCNDVRTLLHSLVFSLWKHWQAQMPDDIMSVQQAQNPSNNFKCRKLIENDSFHIRKLAERKPDLALCQSVGKLMYSPGCSIRIVSWHLPREKNCPEKTIVGNDEVLSLECLFFNSINNLFLFLSYFLDSMPLAHCEPKLESLNLTNISQSSDDVTYTL